MAVKIEFMDFDNLEEKLARPSAADNRSVVDLVRGIIANVAERGDQALIEYTAKFDHVNLRAEQLSVSLKERDNAAAEVSEEIMSSLEVAARRIHTFHENQITESWTVVEDGVMMGQTVTPIKRVGLYVPGGLANYPSSVLMNAIPAKIAGVSEIVLCVPPDQDGSVSKYTLAAAAAIGLEEIYRVGGAQAIAAMAYGTASIKSVDKITGPGNIYVTTAKKLVVGAVDIDMVAGPTEVVIVADSKARPDFIAADMIAQAEHDPMATAILITDDRPLAEAVDQAVGGQLKDAGRAGIVRQSLDARGRIFIVNDLELALEFVNRFAPEHLEIMTEDAADYPVKVKNAGAIFLGNYTPEALGDYVAGSNHVLPTGSTARFYSPLGVYDFIKRSSVMSFTKEAMTEIGQDAITLAETECLDGHGRSVKLRLEEDKGGEAAKKEAGDREQ